MLRLISKLEMPDCAILTYLQFNFSDKNLP